MKKFTLFVICKYLIRTLSHNNYFCINIVFFIKKYDFFLLKIESFSKINQLLNFQKIQVRKKLFLKTKLYKV